MKSKTLAKDVFAFTKDVIIWSLSGGVIYQLFLCFLAVFMLIGVYAYLVQFNLGLAVTNMSDIVSWGFYIANFTFLVGVAAAHRLHGGGVHRSGIARQRRHRRDPRDGEAAHVCVRCVGECDHRAHGCSDPGDRHRRGGLGLRR